MRSIKCIVAVFSLILPSSILFLRVQAEVPDSNAEIALDWRGTGPTGGDVRDLVVDLNDPQRLYFGTLDGQIYTSQDGGRHWNLLYNFNRPKMFIDNILVDPRNSQVIYVAAHRHKEPGGFFKSVDGGRTFRESAQLKGEALHSLAQSSSHPDILIAGSNRGVYRSTDAGESWTFISSGAPEGLENIESLAVDPRTPDIIYAGTWYLPYKTSDGGRTWKSIKNGMIDDSDVFAIDINPRDPNHVIASACSGIYDSRNGGETWRKVQGIPSQSRRTRAILQHPSLPDIVFAGTTEGFWRSTKGGADGSWMLTTSKQLEINSITIHPRNPQTVYIGTNNYGVMVSNDGGKTFAPTNDGYSGRFINAIMVDRERAGRIYATTINTTTGGGFFFVSTDGGNSWQPSMRNLPNRLIGYSLLQDSLDPNTIYMGTNIGIYRSLDRGGSWAHISAPKPEKPASRRRGAQQPSIAVNETVKRAQQALAAAGYDPGAPDGKAGPRTAAAVRAFQKDKGIPVTGTVDTATLNALGLSGLPGPEELVTLNEKVNALSHTYDTRDGRPGLLAATDTGLYRTYDILQGWQRVPYPTGFDTRTSTVSTSPQNPSTLFVGTATYGVLSSRDGGQTWHQVKGVPTTVPIGAIAQDPTRSSYIYVGTKQTLYLSHDGGERWIRRGGNLPLGDYSTIVVSPTNPNEIFAGNSFESADFGGGGVYRSIDAGMTWVRVDPRESRLPSQRIWALAIDKNQNRLLVGSHSAGIFIADRGIASGASSAR